MASFTAGLASTAMLCLMVGGAQAATPPRPGAMGASDTLEQLQHHPGLHRITGSKIVFDRSGHNAAKLMTRQTTDGADTWLDFVSPSTGRWERKIGAVKTAAGATHTADRALAAGNDFWRARISRLVPGTQWSDFELVTNDLTDGVRSLGWQQHCQGIAIEGAYVGLRIKHDTVAIASSSAVPNPRCHEARTSLNEAHKRWLNQQSVDWLATSYGKNFVATGAAQPRWFATSTSGHTLVLAVPVQLQGPEARHQLEVWVSTDGTPLAVRSRVLNGVANVQFQAPVRNPGSGSENFVVPNSRVVINGSSQTTDTTGLLTWDGDAPTEASFLCESDEVRVVSAAGGPATWETTLDTGATTVFAPTDAPSRAQVSALVHGHIARNHARNITPALPVLNDQLLATVNINDQCNAFSDGETINFFLQSDYCENTALVTDIVYHEYGHVVHVQSILEGVGAFDGGFSEGAADFFAVTYTNDTLLGRGFFYDDTPIRDLNPVNDEARWPDDNGEVHDSGMILAGTLWDLYEQLTLVHDEPTARQLVYTYFRAAIARSSNIPTSLPEILLADDSDGDLLNGTPNECLIRRVFAAHGMRTLTAKTALPDVVAVGDAIAVSLEIGAASQCPTDAIMGASLLLNAANENPDDDERIPLAANEAGVFEGQWSPDNQTPGTRTFRLDIQFADGSSTTLPDNLADPDYQVFVGEIIPLFCHSLDTDPLFADATPWTTEGSKPWLWEWGTPASDPEQPLREDPLSAHTGEHILATALNTFYPNSSSTRLRLPPIDIENYSDVRLQFRRFLTVEDALYDTATITANGQVAWTNTKTFDGTTHHLDREWRFADVQLPQVQPGTLADISFALESDEGLEFGGWALDDICVVAVAGAVCGNGAVDGNEQCDEGDNNAAIPDACRPSCVRPTCGDAIIDHLEECDDANTINDDDCLNNCKLSGSAEGCGCQSRSGWPGAALTLGLLLALAPRRRRYSARNAISGSD